MGKIAFLQAVIVGLLLVSCSEKSDKEESTDARSNSEQSSQNQKDTSAVKITALDLNNSLVHYQNLAMEQANFIFESPVDSLHKSIETAVFELKIYREDLKLLLQTKFDYGKPFVKAVYELNDFYIKQFDKELRAVIEKKGEERKKALEQFEQNFDDEEQKHFELIYAAQKTFADYHKIELV